MGGIARRRGDAKIIGKNEVNAIIGWEITGDLLT